MRNRMIIGALIMLLISGKVFAQDTIFLNDNWEQTHRKNASYFRIDKRVSGGWERTDYFMPTKTIQMRGVYSSLNPEIKNGDFRWYYINGALGYAGRFANNQPVGQHMEYYETGTLSAITNYSNGVLHGERKDYYPTGILYSQGSYQQGQQEGLWSYYNEQGALSYTLEYKRDWTLPQAFISLMLPSSHWCRVKRVGDSELEYTFARYVFSDSGEVLGIIDIYIIVEDMMEVFDSAILGWDDPYLDQLVQDVYAYARRTTYSNLAGNGWYFLERWELGDYRKPITHPNSILGKFSKVLDNGVPYFMYAANLINRRDAGVRMYISIPQNLAPQYESEIVSFLRSVREF